MDGSFGSDPDGPPPPNRMIRGPGPAVSLRHVRSWIEDAGRVDVAVYAAIAATPTPSLDRAMSKLAEAADYSRLSIASAAVLALAGGPPGRRAAAQGLASVAVTSAVVNALVKPLGKRHRPDREESEVPFARHVPMPSSSSFPSGHSASAFAFATGVGHTMPRAAIPLRALAALVAYSRVHTGVHYPGDVVAGSLLGSALAQITAPRLAAVDLREALLVRGR
jgi:membrane-associated phospholipid phosphatase